MIRNETINQTRNDAGKSQHHGEEDVAGLFSRHERLGIAAVEKARIRVRQNVGCEGKGGEVMGINIRGADIDAILRKKRADAFVKSREG